MTRSSISHIARPRRYFSAAVALACLFVAATAIPAFAADPHAEALKWFKQARFGMFIHWGIYSILGRGEWVMYHQKIPVHEYEKLQQQFNPTKFNADEWVLLAKQAGMKYMTFTSKHHDGFCMFNSKLTRYSSWYAPCHKDFVKELTDACHRHGLRIFYYYSLLDWHHPDYKTNLPRYVQYAHGQIRELCTNYGKIAGIWFDGGWEHSAEEWHSKELIDMIRSLQPWALVNNRARYDGDFGTPEQRIPGARSRQLFECCFTINHSWGHNARDRNFKSAIQLIQMLADIVGKGGNLLLNVGPLPTGEIPEQQAYRLRQVGQWMKKYGESIYGCDASPFPKTPWGRCTSKGNKLYLHIFNWPDGRLLVVPGLKTKVKKAYLLNRSGDVRFVQREDQLRIHLPPIAPDLADTVLVLELAGPPEVDQAVRPDENGAVALTADRAIIHGTSARVETIRDQKGREAPNIGYWVDAKDWVEWEMVVDRSADYDVTIEWANANGTGGNQVEITFAPADKPDQPVAKISWSPEETGDWKNFQRKSLGTVHLPKGRYKVAVRPVKMNAFAVTNLRGLWLKPQ